MYSVSSIMAGCLCIIHIYFLNDVFTRCSFDTFVWVFICVHWWNGHPLPNSSQYVWTEWSDGVPVFDFSACIFSVKRTKFHFNIIVYIIVRLFFINYRWWFNFNEKKWKKRVNSYPVCKKVISCTGKTFSYRINHFWRLSMASYKENSLLPLYIRLFSMNGWAFGSLKTPISLIFKSITGHWPANVIVKYFQFTYKKETIDFMECIYTYTSIGVYCTKTCIALYFKSTGTTNCYCKLTECQKWSKYSSNSFESPSKARNRAWSTKRSNSGSILGDRYCRFFRRWLSFFEVFFCVSFLILSTKSGTEVDVKGDQVNIGNK